MSLTKHGEAVYIWNENTREVKTAGIIERVDNKGLIYVKDFLSGKVVASVAEGVYKAGTGPAMYNVNETLDDLRKTLID